MQDNPTEVPLGSSPYLEDHPQFFTRKRLAELAAGDFPRWNALDLILRALLEKSCPPGSEEFDNRLASAHIAISGIKPEPPGTDDRRALEKLTDEYILAKLRLEASKNLTNVTDKEKQRLDRSLRDMISEIVTKSAIKNQNEYDIDSNYRRLKRKFEANKDIYLAEATAYFHPLQKARYRKAQKIIKLLSDLGLTSER